MSVDKLSIYNNALVLIGQRYLNNLADDEESQLYLDSVYSFDAVKHCLELSKPTFATKTIKLTSSVASTNHDLDNVFTIPSDYITTVGVFSDAELDQPISRYIHESGTLATDYDTIYFRYISTDSVDDSTYWTASFLKLVSAYLAKEIAPKIDPTKIEQAYQLFELRLKDVAADEEGKRPLSRSVSVATTLTSDWLSIYNDALLLLGLDPIATNNDDSKRRVAIDRALNAGVVSELLEANNWLFALSSYESDYDPSLEPAWGYSRVHAKPDSLHRLTGLFSDARMESPLNVYREEASRIFADPDTVYFEFIDSDYLTNVTLWPSYFKRLVAAKLARDAAPSLVDVDVVVQNVVAEFSARLESAKGLDAALSPPKGMSASVTLTADWLPIYNDALLIMGLKEITSLSNDSNRKVKLDRALNAGVVREILEDHPWVFAITSFKSFYDPSLENEWGYQYTHSAPDNMLRINGIFEDESMTFPLRLYKFEAERFYCDYQEFYLEFVSSDYLTTVTLWPTYFKRLVAAQLANDAANSLRSDGADVDNARYSLEKRKRSAVSNDAQAAPPRIIQMGSWNRSRLTGSYGRGRP